MKRRKENFTDRNRADKHIFRKQSLDDTRQFEGIDPDDYQEDSPDEEMHFDFDESDVEKFRHQNLDDGPDGRTRTGYRSADSRTRVNVKPDRAYRKQDIDENEDTRSPRGGGDTVFFGIANKKKTNSEIRRLSYVMLALIFGVAVYMVYFKIAGSRNVVNNPNNALLSKLEEKVVRGSILSADGEILAKSSQADDGSYYRYYPYSSAFAHVVGTSAVNKSGVEQAADYDLVTSNISPAQKVLNDIKGERSPGNNVITTLDSKLQQTAVGQLSGRKGAIVALDPSTGKVLAMASAPDYDPNTLPSNYKSILADKESKVLLNQATQGLFTPGSIFKLVTTTAYLRSGHDAEKYSYDCQGSISLKTDEGDIKSISCYNGEVHGQVGLTGSFAHSCNASYANIGQIVKAEKLRQVSEELLFNKKLDTDLAAEKSVFDLRDSDSPWTVGATAIGQGRTQITPLHAAMLVSAAANKGMLMKPYVIDKVENAQGGTVREASPSEYGQIFSKSEARTLRKMMKAVVSEGTGYRLQGKAYTAAGKTGTAEVAGQGNNAWFVGFAPADDPKIAVCVLLEDSGNAGSTAVPIAGKLFDSYLGN